MIRIFVDSGCDLTQQQASQLGVTILPLHVRFGEQEYLDGVTMTPDEFYTRLIETDTFPKTSQIPPFQYEEALKSEMQTGDEAVVLTIASRLSGCYHSALLGTKEIQNVYTVDSESCSMGEQLLVRKACIYRDQGMGASEIAAHLEEERSQIRIIALLNTLEYLKKGGRISAVKAMAGRMLGIKPVIQIVHGEVSLLGTARGSKSGGNLLMQYVRQEGLDLSEPFGMVYSGFDDHMLQKYIKDSACLYEGKDPSSFLISRMGAVIGSYAGNDGIGFAFFAKSIASK
ncbi:MAG: DegV family protein [Lactimicrobium sp.]|uniref:DegV family protein n=1 Tax=Lactimicrobium sp. TaxID=2563780 RepID=UPI002F35DEA3